jgi:hypothetical protein
LPSEPLVGFGLGLFASALLFTGDGAGLGHHGCKRPAVDSLAD